MTQLSLNWDAAEAERQKNIGRDVAAAAKESLLSYARELAVRIGRRQPVVTADDVQLALECEGVSVFALGNSAGSLFAGKKWEPVGWTKSKRVHSHGNRLREWRLKDA